MGSTRLRSCTASSQAQYSKTRWPLSQSLEDPVERELRFHLRAEAAFSFEKQRRSASRRPLAFGLASLLYDGNPIAESKTVTKLLTV
jgi:hypothetical protein